LENLLDVLPENSAHGSLESQLALSISIFKEFLRTREGSKKGLTVVHSLQCPEIIVTLRLTYQRSFILASKCPYYDYDVIQRQVIFQLSLTVYPSTFQDSLFENNPFRLEEDWLR